MEEVSLIIDDQVFKVKKEMLTKHSDYFRAMFSGNYVENDRKEIKIDVVDAISMKIILKYMEVGLIDLFEYPLNIISILAVVANFLQITELIKQITLTLNLQLSISNCMEIMSIAENCSYTKLQRNSEALVLLSFKEMKPDYIPSIHKLYWYLSHPYLHVDNEIEVFKFGLDWISHTETDVDALLIILCCLDMKRLTTDDLKEMRTLVTEYMYSLAAIVIDCLQELKSGGYDLCPTAVASQKLLLCEMFTERVYNEVLNLVTAFKQRINNLTPTVPLWLAKQEKPGLKPHSMYKFSDDKGFEKWLDIAEKNLWGWSTVAWGVTKLILVCGEHGRGTGVFMRDVKVYNTLTNEWTLHGAHLPSRRHGGVAVTGDSMFIIGGVGGFRVVLDSGIIYDLKRKSFRKIAKLPDAIQSPAICVHNNRVFTSGQKNIYRYDDKGHSDSWEKVVATEMRMSCMISFKNYVYCMQNYFSQLYRFRPDIDRKLELFSHFCSPPVTACNLGNRLIVFTRKVCGQSDMLTVENYTGEQFNEMPKVIWTQTEPTMVINDVANSCSIVLSVPPICIDIPPYHKRYLRRYYLN
ncbi:kelch-like protein 6 [Aphomia sociella]